MPAIRGVSCSTAHSRIQSAIRPSCSSLTVGSVFGFMGLDRMLLGGELGSWSFKSKTYDTFYEGYMFPLLVKEQLEFRPEKNF
uniref:Uncharacterized protein n=1 Tax=Cucumis melo TaxID=3656 RepID=A0A9I9EFC2_CUCME